jgi:hypothetical protein
MLVADDPFTVLLYSSCQCKFRSSVGSLVRALEVVIQFGLFLSILCTVYSELFLSVFLNTISDAALRYHYFLKLSIPSCLKRYCIYFAALSVVSSDGWRALCCVAGSPSGGLSR